LWHVAMSASPTATMQLRKVSAIAKNPPQWAEANRNQPAVLPGTHQGTRTPERCGFRRAPA
jgi:hypothetical protein